MIAAIYSTKTMTSDEQVTEVIGMIRLSGRTLSDEERNKLIDAALKGVESSRRQGYVKTHSELDNNTKEAILKGKIFIGMGSDQAKASWGPPKRINKTVSASGVHEQWIYSSQYLYFENGKLTSFQSSE